MKPVAGDAAGTALKRVYAAPDAKRVVEASAALSMLLLRDHGMLMVHFVGVPPETLEQFGGAGKYAEAVNSSVTRLGELLRDPEGVRELLLGSA